MDKIVQEQALNYSLHPEDSFLEGYTLPALVSYLAAMLKPASIKQTQHSVIVEISVYAETSDAFFGCKPFHSLKETSCNSLTLRV